MYFSLACILTLFPFLTAAAPPAKVPASRGIAVSIAKHGSPLDGVVDTSNLKRGIRRSVAQVLPSFADRLDDLFITNRKIQEGFATYERNTGVPHPLSGSNPLSGRATGSEPLTDDNNLWFGNISVGTPAQNFTGITSYMTF